MQTSLVAFKVTEQEKKRIKETADKNYLTLSAWMRQTILKAVKEEELKK